MWSSKRQRANTEAQWSASMAGTTDRMTQGSLSLFLEKTKFYSSNNGSESSRFLLRGSPSLLKLNTHVALDYPSLCILQNCIPTASLGTDMITPILQDGETEAG